MVKIRKKPSKRQPTRLREKIKKRVTAHNRKARREAKHDPTWKSKRKDKEFSIPAIAPFREEVLNELQQNKERKIAEREAQRSIASVAALGQAMTAEHEDAEAEEPEAESSEEEEALEVDTSVKVHGKSLRKVIEMSDVILEVLDARDPVGTRCVSVERDVKGFQSAKTLVIVLNKADKVPKRVVEDWLKYLRRDNYVIGFQSSVQERKRQGGGSKSAAALIDLVKKSQKNHGHQTINMGVIGHPNVGKSSLINTLKRSKACLVAPQPGSTKVIQQVSLEKHLNILDCPGVVVDRASETERVLKGTLPVEHVTEPKLAIEVMLRRCDKEYLMMLYNIPFFLDTTGFLIEVARAKGRLRKGGIPDLDNTARSILRDWVAGRIPYYVAAPRTDISNEMDDLSLALNDRGASKADAPKVEKPEAVRESAAVVSELAPAFDLEAIYNEADVEWQTGHDESQVAVPMKSETPPEIDVDMEWSESMDDAPPKPSQNGNKKKRVRVADEEPEDKAASEPEDIVDPLEDGPAIASSKATRKKAKKDKKRLARQNIDQDMDDADEEPEEPPRAPRKPSAPVGAPYDFAEFLNDDDDL